jgi:hypothetical protein
MLSGGNEYFVLCLRVVRSGLFVVARRETGDGKGSKYSDGSLRSLRKLF